MEDSESAVPVEVRVPLKWNPLFIVGSPRSGTTFLSNWIGEKCDHVAIEWQKFHIDMVRDWELPDGQVLIKWCHLFQIAPQLVQLYPNCGFVEIQRDPLNVVYSMSRPKRDARPPRPFETLGTTPVVRLMNAIKWWHFHVSGCREQSRCWPERWLTVSYERLPSERQRLNEFLSTDLREIPEFQNRNVSGLSLEWINHELVLTRSET